MWVKAPLHHQLYDIGNEPRLKIKNFFVLGAVKRCRWQTTVLWGKGNHCSTPLINGGRELWSRGRMLELSAVIAAATSPFVLWVSLSRRAVVRVALRAPNNNSDLTTFFSVHGRDSGTPGKTAFLPFFSDLIIYEGSSGDCCFGVWLSDQSQYNFLGDIFLSKQSH